MRFLSRTLVLAALFSSVVSFGAPSLDAYRDNACPEGKAIEGLQAREVLSMDEFFEKEGLIGTNVAFGRGGLIFDVDEIYANNDLSRLVLTKFCLEPANAADLGTLVEMEGGDFLYHQKTPAGLPFALYFVGQTHAAVQAFTSALNAALRIASKDEVARETASGSRLYARASSWIFPVANAQKNGLGTNHDAHVRRMQELRERRADKEGTVPAKKKDTLRDVFSNVSQCVQGLGQGVYNATVGVVEYAVKSVFNFVKSAAFAATHPKQAWQRVGNRVKEVVSVIRNFNAMKIVDKEKKGFAAMPTREKTRFICEVIAQVGTAGAMALFAAPSISLQAAMLWQLLAQTQSLGSFKHWFFSQAPDAAGSAAPSTGKSQTGRSGAAAAPSSGK